jgi:hypothetical protein
MDRRARLEELRKEFPQQTAETKRQRLERLRAEFKTTSPEDYVKTLEGQSRPVQPDTMGELVGGAYQKLGETVGTAMAPIAYVSSGIDKYVGAPMRAYLGSVAEERMKETPKGLPPAFFSGLSTEPFKAAARQFGEDPSKAPTFAQITETYGAPKEKNIPLLGVQDFGIPGKTKIVPKYYSGSDIAGAALGTVLDPTNIIPELVPYKYLSKIGADIAQKSPTAQRLIAGARARGAQKAARQFTVEEMKIPESTYEYVRKPETFERLEKRQAAGRGADTTQLQQEMLETANYYRNELEDQKEIVRKNRNNLKQQLRDAKREIKLGKTPTVDQVNAVKQVLENDKALYGQLSQIADDSLSNANILVSTDDLYKIVDEIYEEMPQGTPLSLNAAQKMKVIRDQIHERYKGYLDGPMIRDWKQDISKTINHGYKSGEFNEIYDLYAKKLERKLGKALKDAGAKEGQKTVYAQAMELMSELSDTRNEIMDLFAGGKGFTSSNQFLKKLMDEANPVEADALKEILENYLTKKKIARETGKKITEEGSFTISGEVLRQGEIDEQTIRDILAKSELERVQQRIPESSLAIPARKKLEMSEKQAIKMKEGLQGYPSITPASTKTVIEKVGRDTTEREQLNYQNQIKALEQARQRKAIAENIPEEERKAFVPFAQEARDIMAEREFLKARPGGSVRTTPRTILGGVGGIVASSVAGLDPLTSLLSGAITGELARRRAMKLEVSGGKMAREKIAKEIATQKSLEALEKKIKDPEFLAKNEKIARKIQQIGEVTARNGVQMGIFTHQLLMQNDPEYRKAILEGEE